MHHNNCSRRKAALTPRSTMGVMLMQRSRLSAQGKNGERSNTVRVP